MAWLWSQLQEGVKATADLTSARRVSYVATAVAIAVKVAKGFSSPRTMRLCKHTHKRDIGFEPRKGRERYLRRDVAGDGGRENHFGFDLE